jgi:hypothetical protein
VKKLILHGNNARAHTAEKGGSFCAQNGPLLATQSLYSSGVTPSDFFLFQHLNRFWRE